MIHKSSLVSDRRILTYPTVYPEATLPTTLLTSLIDLATSIGSLKSQSSFSSNSRNALETFRNVSNILIFFEEVNLPETSDPSLLLSLSELHLALQKLRYLLADCTHEGARLWMLMNSDRVANQFWLLTRAMATSFDVLPMDSIEAPREVKELVHLFMKQSRKARFEVSSRDRNAMDEVSSVLDRLRCGTIPEKDNLGQVLDYVGVRSWSECNNEVKFLESEIAFESNFGDERKRKVGFLSDLMGFMCYCRCVCFDVVDHPPISSSRSTIGNINPEDIRCPISLELMADPVATATGHTYDRASIIKWFRSGNPICPNTGERLTTKDLIPNVAVQRVIEKYCSENDIYFPQPRRTNRDTPKMVHGPVAENSMKMIAKFLAEQLEEGCAPNRAAYEIRVLAKTSIFNRSCLAETGVIIPRLVELLGFEDGENAIAALLSLSKDSIGKAVIVNNGGLRSIVKVLKNGVKVEAREHAAATLFYLASVEEYRKSMGEIPDTVPALMKMVREGTVRGQKNALVAIFGLLVHKANHWRVLAAGAVPLLIQILKSSSDREDNNIVTDSLAVLSSLAEKPEGATAILRVAGALEGVMEILRDSTSRTRNENCVALLLSLCINGGKEAMCGLAKSSSLMESLYATLGEGTSRTSKKASALIKILHEFYERRSCGSAAKVLPQERFVHAW